jgi:hypothetical protein
MKPVGPGVVVVVY